MNAAEARKKTAQIIEEMTAEANNQSNKIDTEIFSAEVERVFNLIMEKIKGEVEKGNYFLHISYAKLGCTHAVAIATMEKFKLEGYMIIVERTYCHTYEGYEEYEELDDEYEISWE